jgi:hypothetical protein
VTFYNGSFCDGSFCSRGPFVTGTFSDGTFCDGSFCDGTFFDGSFSDGSLYVGVNKGHWKWWALKLQRANPSFSRLFSCIGNIELTQWLR